MTSHTEGPGEGASLRPPLFAHIEDSVALAEHILPAELRQRLKLLGKRATSFGLLLRRASLYNEYALATPGFAGDDGLFAQAHEDLDRIIQSNLGSRHQIRFGANVLLAYEEAFRLRASFQPITDEVQQRLQGKISEIMLDFLDGPDLRGKEYGQLSELITISYLLNGDLFPYFASWREEANIIRADNHDVYTLHPCEVNRLKKVPASIKYREIPPKNNAVVTLTVGRLALAVAQSIPPYSKDGALYRPGKEARATRLAADIAICNTNGEILSVEDKAFLWSLTAQLQAPLVEFAARPSTPNYASNAEALRQEIVAREQRAKLRSNQAAQSLPRPGLGK